MLVSGFTFVRNGELLGYPYLESLHSLLSICDEVIVAVGPSDDNTLNTIKAINNPKLRVIETTWNESMQDRGYTYAQQKMIAQFMCNGDWAFYLEADEVIHENDYETIRKTMETYCDDLQVEALVFDYYHFYGAPEYYAYSPRWYRRAPRIIRNTIRSWAPDGLFWLIMDKNRKGHYPKAALTKTYLYHYGHVRSIEKMNEKQKRVERYWGKDPKKFTSYGNIDYKTIRKFKAIHPAIMNNWLQNEAQTDFLVNPNYKLSKRDIKHRVMMWLEKLYPHLDLSKKHYHLIRS